MRLRTPASGSGITRRELLQFAAAAGSVSLAQRYAIGADDVGPAELPAGTRSASLLYALPGKRALIKRTFRPPNFETPLSYFNSALTPNDAFFVRYHLANVPAINPEAWHLAIGGSGVEAPYALTLGDLRTKFEAVELTALCFCSGNRRGLFMPHVPGIEWGHGAMGNARFKGVRLRDVLARARLGKQALEVACDGADTATLESTPDFVKSIPIWKAMDENTLIAYEMNGEPLPRWNGFPVRLVVPGWTATYWMKHLTSINVLSHPWEGFWMRTAYRIPNARFPVVDRFWSQENELNTPITEMVVNSLITNIADGQKFKLGEDIDVRGVAWDGGYGIARVEVSGDEGNTWYLAELGRDQGRYSWRQWGFRFRPSRGGRYAIMAKATNRLGTTQVFELIANPAGYHNNAVQKLNISVADA